MNLLTAIVFGILSGAGVYLMMRHDLTKLVAGTLLITNAAILLLVSAGFSTRVRPTSTGDSPALLADPLVQALALTAVVINFATAVLLMRVMVTVESTHGSLDTVDLVRAEIGEEQRTEHKDDAAS